MNSHDEPGLLSAKRETASALSQLRKESLDLYNRIHSVAEDVNFVNQVLSAYPHLPVLPNLRCGAWYVDPKTARQEPAYFKSTDGHFGNWSFNLRRPNLHLLSIVVSEGGFILVDSTRSGKRIPDALAKTVPIWCAVINRAVRIKYPGPEKEDWNTKFYCPPGAVSGQEQAQIEARIDQWVDALLKSAYILSDLSQPLRPFWVTPSTSVFPCLSEEQSFYPIVCVSASKQIHEGLERRSSGFVYVQGAGDDHELWGMGLTPQLFWDHKKMILDTGRAELPGMIKSLVAVSRGAPDSHEKPFKPTPILHVGGLLSIGITHNLPSPLPRSLPNSADRAAFVVIAPDDLVTTGNSPREDGAHVLRVHLAGGKKDNLQFLHGVLPQAMQFIGNHLNQGTPVCVCCESGKDASAGVALAALQLFFDDMGQYVSEPEQQTVLRNNASKQSISKRLQWIISSRPEANPSRATLKRVNEYILTSPSFRRSRGPH